MPRYLHRGQIPRKRHTQFRHPDGSLYAEEVFGVKGFSGIASILYHLYPPTQMTDYASVGDSRPELLPDEPLCHHHLRTKDIAAFGDCLSGRIPLLVNEDVSIGLCRPVGPMPGFFKNADGDELLYIHEGKGTLETIFGPLSYRAGDYLIIPRGTIYRLSPETGTADNSVGNRMLVIESAGTVEVPRRYRNEYGQMLEHAPYCERDIRVPEEMAPVEETGRFEVQVKARGYLTACYYDHHPFDLIGWDGCLYPWALNIGDFEPITGSLHQPPPTHQTFEGRNFVVCSFVPRMLDYHPDAVPVPYHHSNLESDEVLYYCNDRFGSRRGIEEGSITLHPAGLPHGPQPGVVEASLGRTRTEELAVMLDTFRPLHLTHAAADLDDPQYPYSWSTTAS